jgi:hypothetical protein
MAKKTPKPKVTRDTASVPCLRVVIGGKQGKTGEVDAKSCAIVGEGRVTASKFDLNRKIGTTSKTVATPKKNKPCLNALKRAGCPVQLAFDNGQPFLRFCTVNGKPGHRVDVNTPAEAVRKADEACAEWKRTKTFASLPAEPLAGSRRKKRS